MPFIRTAQNCESSRYGKIRWQAYPRPTLAVQKICRKTILTKSSARMCIFPTPSRAKGKTNLCRYAIQWSITIKQGYCQRITQKKSSPGRGKTVPRERGPARTAIKYPNSATRASESSNTGYRYIFFTRLYTAWVIICFSKQNNAKKLYFAETTNRKFGDLGKKPKKRTWYRCLRCRIIKILYPTLRDMT